MGSAARSIAPLTLLVLVVVTCFYPTAATNLTHYMDTLQTDLLLNYNMDQAPIENSSSPVVVSCSFILTAVLNFNELDMELSTYGYLSVSWNDARLTWSTAPYGNLYHIVLPINKVWAPTVALNNPSGTVYTLNQAWMKVRYIFNGAAYWGAGENLKSVCSVDVTYYPFDTQLCEIQFVPMYYSPSEVRFVSPDPKAVVNNFREHPQWTLTDTAINILEIPNGYSMYTIQLYLKRKPEFFIINMLLPILFMALLNILVFALPTEAGERMSYCITVLLAIAVFLTLLSDNLPKSSNPMSILSYFLMVELSLSVVICLATIINLRIFHSREDEPIPSWLKDMTLLINKLSCTKLAGICRRPDNERSSKTANVTGDTGSDLTGNTRETSHPPGYTAHASDVRMPANAHALPMGAPDQAQRQGDKAKLAWDKQEAEEPVAKETDHVTWQDVSLMLDKVFALFCTLVVIVTVIVFCAVVINRT